jgi:hypothetical protein
MIADRTASPQSQTFRVRSSPGSSPLYNITIPTRHDQMTSQQVVRWKDVLQYFENATGIMNGEDAVLFLTGDDLEE